MIYLGSDHGGFELKETIKQFLTSKNYKYKDLGALKLDSEDDYPIFAFSVAKKVGEEDNPNKKWDMRAKGILFCRSSAGMIIAANKVRNVRAASVFDVVSAKHSREHNDANIIALSGDWLNEKSATEIVDIWLKTDFSNEERHKRRLEIIKEYENKNL